MFKSKKVVFSFIGTLLILLIASFFVACGDDVEETENNYPVVGIWHAQATWREDNPYNYGGDICKLDIWFDFREDGTLKNKLILLVNGYTLSDTDWIIANLTWSVKDNVITLSNGKQFVIVDDEFNDIYPDPKMILHYKKELSE